MQKRVALVALAAVGLTAAFIIARPGGDGSGGQTATSSLTTGPTTTSVITNTTTNPPPARPRLIVVRTQGARPVGGIRTVSARNGDLVQFAVASDTADEVHVHGYDISKPVAPGKRAVFRFRAQIEGVFEIELEGAGVQIVKLVVNP